MSKEREPTSGVPEGNRKASGLTTLKLPDSGQQLDPYPLRTAQRRWPLLHDVADISDERILNAIEIYSDIGAAQNHRNSLSSEGMKIVQLDPGDATRQTPVEYYFTALKHLSDIISMVLEKIEKLLPKLPS